MTTAQKWQPCTEAEIDDILRWNEPIWAAPNKARGKPDQIGEQQITARLMAFDDILEFEVIHVEKISDGDVPLKVQPKDQIKRKDSTIEKGDCHKLLAS